MGEGEMRRAGSLWQRGSAGFTLIEAVLVVALLGVVTAIILPQFLEMLRDLRIKRAIAEMRSLEFDIEQYDVDNEVFPASLNDLDSRIPLDPWGQEYVYFRFSGPGWEGKARKDRFLVPINTYFDLYSKGPDGDSAVSLQAQPSRDDIIRANDGQYYGLASDY